MIASVVKIGNSRGIRIPRNILRELNIEDEVEMLIQNNELIIKSVNKKPRQGWNDAFAKMSASGSRETKAEKLLLPENIESESFEWIW